MILKGETPPTFNHLCCYRRQQNHPVALSRYHRSTAVPETSVHRSLTDSLRRENRQSVMKKQNEPQNVRCMSAKLCPTAFSCESLTVISPLAKAPAPWNLVHSFPIQQSSPNPQNGPVQSPGSRGPPSTSTDLIWADFLLNASFLFTTQSVTWPRRMQITIFLHSLLHETNESL